MSIQPAKTGVFISEVQGKAKWFLVEFEDGSVSVHPTWEEAMMAGNFGSSE